jgi:hypothetical protein
VKISKHNPFESDAVHWAEDLKDPDRRGRDRNAHDREFWEQARSGSLDFEVSVPDYGDKELNFD